jgi:molybdopterin-guanine dinucleotide biosynthesis protein B
VTAPRVFGIVGWKNSGKTTLVVALIQEFARRGLRVSTIKHAHHDFDIDIPGKDSHRHRFAGASEVIVASAARWALMHESRGDPSPSLGELVQRLSPCDLVLVEGYKATGHPKIEVAWSKPTSLIADSDPSVLAVVTEHLRPTRDRRVLAPHDIPGIANFVLSACGMVTDRIAAE